MRLYPFRPLYIPTLLSLLTIVTLHAKQPVPFMPGTERQTYNIYTDPQGVLRRSDTKEEVSYFGTNYNLTGADPRHPLTEDIKERLDRDVYHMARLGMNAARLNLTDAELSDSAGNFLPNARLDYLTSALEKRDIDIILNLRETNKDLAAQLMRHKNPYTGRTYAKDRAIIITETPDADTPGAVAHEWYPTGFGAGKERKGNFLPAVDRYELAGAATMAGDRAKRLFIYEFDAADVNGSYLYPAIARTLRGKGYQWMTQFAYDPMESAAYNTDYPTHYLNLAYTPAKALSMMIAGEAARTVERGAYYGDYPEDTRFEGFTVDYHSDLSLMNTPEKYIATNSTMTAPVEPAALRLIAGRGSNPAVRYTGSGAYFLDATDIEGIWRLEVMPDVAEVSDPFGHISTFDAKRITTSQPQLMTIDIPALGPDFFYTPANTARPQFRRARKGSIEVTPGVYLLGEGELLDNNLHALKDPGMKVARNIGLTEYAAPADTILPVSLLRPAHDFDGAEAIYLGQPGNIATQYINEGYGKPEYYNLKALGNAPGDHIVIAKYVGDLIKRIPDAGERINFHAKFRNMRAIPENPYLEFLTTDGESFRCILPLEPTYEPDGSVCVTAACDPADIFHAPALAIPRQYPETLPAEIPTLGNELKTHKLETIRLVFPLVPGRELDVDLERIWFD